MNKMRGCQFPNSQPGNVSLLLTIEHRACLSLALPPVLHMTGGELVGSSI